MTPQWHRIFAAMPFGRPVTAEELYRRAKPALPRGWGVGDVVAALRRFQRDGDVSRDEVERVGIWTRVTR